MSKHALHDPVKAFGILACTAHGAHFAFIGVCLLAFTLAKAARILLFGILTLDLLVYIHNQVSFRNYICVRHHVNVRFNLLNKITYNLNIFSYCFVCAKWGYKFGPHWVQPVP